jgi:hypothetical protein
MYSLDGAQYRTKMRRIQNVLIDVFKEGSLRRGHHEYVNFGEELERVF